MNSHTFSSITDLVGNTPLLKLTNLRNKLNLHAEILAKLEFFNPGGSIKDRAVLAMLKKAEEDGLLKPGSTIIEPTSGNTGIALAAIGSAKGYKVIVVMPENMSPERHQIARAYGAKLELTPVSAGMLGAIARAEELHQGIEDSLILGQFINLANPAAHFETTGPEIYAATEGKIDIFVAGVGTGGTLSGTGEYLKARIPDLIIVAVEPTDSAVLSGGHPGPHKIQGIGAGFVPEILKKSLIDEIEQVKAEDAQYAARILASIEGILGGISSGASLWASIVQARKNPGKVIVTILPDSGEKYLSMGLFEDYI